MTTPALSHLDGLVADLVSGERDVPQTLARLRAHGYTADPVALLDAKSAIDARDRFLYRDGDPFAFTGLEPDALRRVDVWQLAIDKAETDYTTALHCMARPTRIARAAS